ncbi:S-protein homolog 5-like [Cicer arietinum]|uniref:S-protein homolog n=1 Tax=Cicer arietinum TaxID=3827 RepID=A0A3Q7YD92_CICAR|nr:S-protein homolog 5-like [Cicer arietinum]
MELKALIISVLLVVIRVGVQASQTNSFFGGRSSVLITNDLPAPSKLIVHCKSGDDDLGIQNLPTGGQKYWTFRPNIFGTTLFYCYFNWDNMVMSVEVFNDKHDGGECTGHCLRSVRKDGIYFLNAKDGLWERKKSWTPQNSKNIVNYQ